VSDWTEGYVTDTEYTFGYYGELNPLRAALPLIKIGFSPGKIVTACELGYGQGVSINMHAAASDVCWYGTDFNPAHAAFARHLAERAGSDARLFDDSFAEFCARPDLPEFDFIGLHGIWSWVSDETQRVIVEFVQRKLKVGGVLYISYNTQPGFLLTLPLRHLLTEYAETMGAAGHGTVARIDAALEFADKLMELKPAFATANPGLAERLKYIKGQNRNYLAHEYFNRDWHALPFAEMAKRLEPAKLSFAGSANYLDHIEGLNLMPEQRRFLAGIPDPLFRESVRDFIINCQFRREYWIRGPRRLRPAEQADAVRAQRIMLVSRREDVLLTVAGALGRRQLSATIYDPILDALGDGKARSIGDIERSVARAGMRLGTIVEAVLILAGKADIVFVQDEAAQARAKPRTDRLNLALFERARGGAEVTFLASPLIGGGVNAGRFQHLAMLAMRHGSKTAAELARFIWDILSRQGQRVTKDNKPLETPEENLAELETQARDFLDKRLAILRRLKIV